MDGTLQRSDSHGSVDSSGAFAAAAVPNQLHQWFGHILPLNFFDSLKQDLEIVENSCIFTLRVTTWMMMMQRFSSSGTLDDTVSELLHGNGRQLLEPCKRVRDNNISANTGGYSRARQKMPEEAARRIAGRSFEQLLQIRSAGGLRDRLFLLDGSSVRLAHTAANLEAFPAAENQHGPSHWPAVRVVVMHHLTTALAMAPQFGPMYGAKAVGEQRLAEPLIDSLPPNSVLIGDRNFGVFSVTWHAHSREHRVLVRMTQQRAGHLVDGELSSGEHHVVWEPTREDRHSNSAIPAEACIEGRLIAARPDGLTEDLYLFTTLEEPAEEVIALYRERWNIETDLRSVKNEVRLHTIESKSPRMVACELLIAIASYNLVRTAMAEAARQVGLKPRELSFSRSRNAFRAFACAVAHAESDDEFDRHWRLLLRIIGQSRLYQRQRPSAPREVWHKRQNFPSRKVNK